MTEHNIKLDDVELTIHFSDDNRRRRFAWAFRQSVDNRFLVDARHTSILRRLRVFDMPVNLDLKHDDHYRF